MTDKPKLEMTQTRKRALKRAARARARREFTGEKYTTARAAILAEWEAKGS